LDVVEMHPQVEQPLVVPLSAIAKGQYLAGPGTIVVLCSIFALAAPTIPGKVVAVAITLAIDFAVARAVLKRLAGITFAIGEHELLVRNKTRSSAAFGIPWSDVASVDRGWRYLAIPFGLRGSMLRVTPRAGAEWRAVYLFASYGASRRTCRAVVPLLHDLARTNGFAVSDRLGTGFGFTKARLS
jgi:hypothetical protein